MFRTYPAQQMHLQNMVDLHGLSPDRSKELVNWHLQTAQETNTKSIRFVTGRGNHINQRGERGTLYRNFLNWLTEEHLNIIKSVNKGDGFYDVNIKPRFMKKQFAISNLTEQWLQENFGSIQTEALQGGHNCQFLLAHCHQYGIGTTVNFKKAVIYYHQAVQHNNPCAQHALGGCYWQGQGVRQNDQKAIELFEAAAKQNFAWSLHQLGDIFYYGQGVECDSIKAAEYYKKASYLGLDIAKRKLAHAYFAGNGVEENKEKAFLLYKEVADNGDAHSAYNVALCYAEGHGVIENPKMAFEYAKRSADSQDPDGAYFAARCYQTGYGVIPDSELFLKYLTRSAELKFKHALFQLSLYYGAQGDEKKQLSFLIEAAEMGHIIAQALMLSFYNLHLSADQKCKITHDFWKQDDEELLSILHKLYKFTVMDAYIHQENLTKNQKKKIIRLLKTLAKEDEPSAFLRLGMCYMESDLVKKNLNQAEMYLLKGANFNDMNCHCSLGYFYEEGQAGAVDYQKAFYHHSKAAELGSANSQHQLGLFYLKGLHVKKDFACARLHFTQAVEADQSEKRFKACDSFFPQPPVFLHAAYCLGVLFLKGDVDTAFPSDSEKAVFWLIQASKVGHEEARSLLAKLEVPTDIIKLTPTLSHSIWKKPPVNKMNLFDLLKDLTNKLDVQTEWKMTKDDKAWCFLTPNDLGKIKDFDLDPIVIRKTKSGQHILLLEKVSCQNIDIFFQKIQEQCTLKLNNLTI